LEIKPGELFTLLGPSGCGKTTLLRMIIGFNSINGGVIEVGNKAVNQIPVSKRNMGMVFQNYAIFPHMNVRENIRFGLKNRKMNKEEMEKRIDDILKVVKIEQYQDRMPEKLSGGQQQRVALARAIVIHPNVLLMDEPLSNLDAKLRVEMRNAIKQIQQQVGITTVYVTHDQEEALAISDRIAVMNGGVIQQIGQPKEIYERPVNIFVSKFIGTSNVLTAKAEMVKGYPQVRFTDTYSVEVPNLSGAIANGDELLVSIRPQEFLLSTEGPGLPGVIKSTMFLGVNTHYFVDLGLEELVEVVSDGSEGKLLPEGTKVTLQVQERKINVFDSEENTLVKVGEAIEVK
jgi:iron(III) transport system ATP-binding protein